MVIAVDMDVGLECFGFESKDNLIGKIYVIMGSCLFVHQGRPLYLIAYLIVLLL